LTPLADGRSSYTLGSPQQQLPYVQGIAATPVRLDWRLAAGGRARHVSRRLAADGALPKTIVYNVNPTDNYAFATMVGNFAENSVPGKMQFGGGWWYLDQKEGIEWQLNISSNVDCCRALSA